MEGGDALVGVDCVQWMDFRFHIVHFYTRRGTSVTCRSFIPIEETQPPMALETTARPRLLKTAAGVKEVAHLELGGHALLDIRRSVVKRWLGHSEADIKSVGRHISTLVNVPVFCRLVRRQKAVHTTEWWAAHQNTTFHSADELMAAAGHVANPPPIFGMVCCTIVSHCTSAWRRCVAGGERCLGNVADPNRRFYWTVFLNSHLRGGFALCFCTCRVVACHRRTRSLASQRRERLMRMSSRMELKGPRRSRRVSTTCLGSWR